MKTPCALICFCQSRRDPGITDSSIPDPGTDEKRDPGLQSLLSRLGQLLKVFADESLYTIIAEQQSPHKRRNYNYEYSNYNIFSLYFHFLYYN